MKPYYKSLSYTINSYSVKNELEPKITQIDRRLVKKESGTKPKIKKQSELFINNHKLKEGAKMTKLDLILLAESVGVDIDDLLSYAILEAIDNDEVDDYNEYKKYNRKRLLKGAGIGGAIGAGLGLAASKIGQRMGVPVPDALQNTIVSGASGALIGGSLARRLQKDFKDYRLEKALRNKRLADIAADGN